MAKILIIDDDRILVEMLAEQMTGNGHEAASACNLTGGLALLRQSPFDVVLLDVQLPDGNGLEYIPAIAASPANPEVIIITGQGEADGAEKAVVSGAWSYIEKPYIIRELSLQLTRVLQYRKEKLKVSTMPIALKRDKIIGNSPAIRKCLNQIARASASDVSVLVTGATGTGKELFARAIHENGSRAEKNFVVVDCAALPETLIESTLFGHVKGAFTNADASQDGLVKHAHLGTLFLDEVGELPLNIQKTFLRLLQEHEYRPVGSTKHLYSDFRVVAATNRNLQECVEKGTFREDLLFRLQAFVIDLPQLRLRKEDIRDLVLHFVAKLCQRYGMEIKGVAGDFIEALLAYEWPGNVRELFQTMEQVFTNPLLGPTCFAIHLPEKFRVQQARAGVKVKTAVLQDEPCSLPTWGAYKSRYELEYLGKLKVAAGGNVTEAARLSGISRTRLYQLFVKYGVEFS
ncbi:MAG: Fis family transcriptional regulator [Desulfobulbaceae bacterium BRH_c16a]|nr:MAG: Fis family transcriptional regulator [Desulfobulbaceae bacterium BRH_c16a]